MYSIQHEGEMSMNRLRFVLRRFLRRRDLESELKEELAFHIDLETALRVRDGQSTQVARQEALRQFGNIGLVAEVTRRQWGFTWLEQFWSDLKIAWRQAARSPRLTLAVIDDAGNRDRRAGDDVQRCACCPDRSVSVSRRNAHGASAPVRQGTRTVSTWV